MLQLLEKAEIRDVLATAGVHFEQMRRMGPFGGVVLQLQGIMQKGFTKVCPAYIVPVKRKKQEDLTPLVCIMGVFVTRSSTCGCSRAVIPVPIAPT